MLNSPSRLIALSRICSSAAILVLLFLFATQTTVVVAFSTPSSRTTGNVVVYGPQSRELLLLVSKLAAQQPGYTAACICAPGTEEGCRRLLYGKEYAEAAHDVPQHARPISSPEDMSDALQQATALVLIGNDQPVEADTLTTFLKYTKPHVLQKIVLISKMGVTKKQKGGGFFYMGAGGNDAKLFESEQTLAQISSKNNLPPLSIIRAGILKGGGPGLDDDGNPLHPDWGLDKCYYNTFLDVVEAKVTMAHDKFSLGADSTSVMAGDPHSLPNVVAQLGNKSSFDPSPTDSNRIVVASAAVAALQLDHACDISVGTAAGRTLPTTDEWLHLFQAISSSSSSSSSSPSSSSLQQTNS